MKSDVLRTSIIATVSIGVIAALLVFIGAMFRSSDRQQQLRDQQCQKMCTSGVNSCEETNDYKSLVVNCNIDGGHILMVQELVKAP